MEWQDDITDKLTVCVGMSCLKQIQTDDEYAKSAKS